MPRLARPETLPAQAERRRWQRTHVVTSVTVAWHTEDGRFVTEQAETVDVSASGALLRMEKDHPLRQVVELIRGPEPEHTLARVMRSGPLSPEGGTLVALQLAAPSEVFWGIEFYSGV
jgi:hypothetical protein